MQLSSTHLRSQYTEKVANAQFWPQGIYFRGWRDSRLRQNEEQERQAGDTAI